MSDSTPSTMRAASQPRDEDAARELSNGNLEPTADLVDYAKSYARERPEVAALWCLGIGFILGWKLKPW